MARVFIGPEQQSGTLQPPDGGGRRVEMCPLVNLVGQHADAAERQPEQQPDSAPGVVHRYQQLRRENEQGDRGNLTIRVDEAASGEILGLM